MIRVRDLSIIRNGHRVLDSVTLDIPRGGITALIGPNGAGKSTLLHALAGLMSPSSGIIEIDGIDVTRARPQARAELLALVAQSEAVTARLTVRDLVTFGRWPHHHGRPVSRDREMIDTAIGLFGLDDLATRTLETLSGGQRQRAFVAMAWAQETPWMLLDEPLSALDPKYAREIMDRLHEQTREGAGKSVVVILHDLATAARYADRVVALKAGCRVADGAAANVFTDRILTDLYETDLAVSEVDGVKVVVPA